MDDDDVAYRRVASIWVVRTEDGDVGFRSGAFQDTSAARAAELGCPGPGMSVHLSSVMEEMGLELEELVEEPGEGVVAMRVGDLRAAGMGVDAWPFEHEPAHAVVFNLTGPKRTRSQQRTCSKAATWAARPPASS